MDLFLELLQVALGNRSGLSRIPTSQEWDYLYEVSMKQTVAGIVYAGIERLTTAERPRKELLLKWFATMEQIKRQNRRINHDAVALTALLEKDGWDNVILKGQGVAMLYPEPLLRMSGDIDVFVKGKRAEIISYLKKRCGGPLTINVQEAVCPFFEQSVVEIHFTPALLCYPVANRQLQQFIRQQTEMFTQTVELPEHAGNVHVPPKVFNAVFLLAHIYRHLFGEGVGLRQVVDYYYFLKSQNLTDDEREEAVRVLGKLRMTRFARGMMYIMHDSLGLTENRLLLEADKREGEFLLQEIMRGGNFCRYDNYTIPWNESRPRRLFRVALANKHLLLRYPQEVIFNPVFSVWQYLWRWRKGFLP